MSFKIVVDSSSNITGSNFAVVPLKIYLGEKEYIDNEKLDVDKMMQDFANSKEKSSTSCPNISEWSDAFFGADEIFAITISSNLSASYSCAVNAKEQYLSTHSDAKICIIDSLSVGPEMELIVQKILELKNAGKDFYEIEKEIKEYQNKTHLLFWLKSLDNLARNGRINGTVAKVVSALGIEIVGKASDVGELQLLHKCRGSKKALVKLVEELKNSGFSGKSIITHCNNEQDSLKLKELICESFPDADITINKCRGLCAYYAQNGGVVFAFQSN
ncbi:MAG: DegV family protein [Clostridia bacterium]|nr:DegV family protein [Clostridia bacterium]